MFCHSNRVKQTALPAELAPIYLFVASDDSTYVLGQNINVNGGEFFEGMIAGYECCWIK